MGLRRPPPHDYDRFLLAYVCGLCFCNTFRTELRLPALLSHNGQLEFPGYDRITVWSVFLQSRCRTRLAYTQFAESLVKLAHVCDGIYMYFRFISVINFEPLTDVLLSLVGNM